MTDIYPPPGSRSFQRKAEQYRVRAEELSAISGQFHEDKPRAMLEKLATEYLKMAEQMDGLSEIEERLEPRKSRA
jgi:hypothetical protein